MIGKCVVCGVERRMHRDHIIPRRLGGPDAPGNIQLLCANCHEDKTALQAQEIGRAIMTKEVRAKISAKLKGRPLSPEHRAKLTAAKQTRSPVWNKGKATPIETRVKMSLSQKGRIFTSAHRAKLSAAKKGTVPWNKGKPSSVETRIKLRLAHERRHLAALWSEAT